MRRARAASSKMSSVWEKIATTGASNFGAARATTRANDTWRRGCNSGVGCAQRDGIITPDFAPYVEELSPNKPDFDNFRVRPTHGPSPRALGQRTARGLPPGLAPSVAPGRRSRPASSSIGRKSVRRTGRSEPGLGRTAIARQADARASVFLALSLAAMLGPGTIGRIVPATRRVASRPEATPERPNPSSGRHSVDDPQSSTSYRERPPRHSQVTSRRTHTRWNLESNLQIATHTSPWVCGGDRLGTPGPSSFGDLQEGGLEVYARSPKGCRPNGTDIR